MKTNTNITKDSARQFRADYLAMQAEVERRRAEYFRMKKAMHTAENEVIEDMWRVVIALSAAKGSYPTAAEITRAMNGRMTRHEVVGQLTVALGEHYNGTGRTHNATHEPTGERIGKAKARYCYQTRRFAEVDDRGNLVENGATIEVQKHVKTYGVEG